MSDEAHRVVFDCNIFVQTLITPSENAAKCVEHLASRSKPESISFKAMLPDLVVLQPEQLLELLR
jgi:hypothetical protein